MDLFEFVKGRVRPVKKPTLETVSLKYAILLVNVRLDNTKEINIPNAHKLNLYVPAERLLETRTQLDANIIHAFE